MKYMVIIGILLAFMGMGCEPQDTGTAAETPVPAATPTPDNREVVTRFSIDTGEDLLEVIAGETDITDSVSGSVMEDGQSAGKVPLRVYKVINLELGTVFLFTETFTENDGTFTLDLPIYSMYFIRAGVSEEEWELGLGSMGGRFLDLNFSPPEDFVISLAEFEQK